MSTLPQMRLIQDLISLGLGFISNENDGVERRAKTPLTPAVIIGQGQSQEFSIDQTQNRATIIPLLPRKDKTMSLLLNL